MSLARYAPKDSGWRYVYIHKECGAYFEFPHDDHWFVQDEPCPKCGGSFIGGMYGNCDRATARWVGTSKILKPSTWGDGYWQHKE